LARFKLAELKEDRAEPKFAAPPPRVRRARTSRTWILIRSAKPNLESRGGNGGAIDFIAAARRAALQAAADSDAVDASQKVRRAARARPLETPARQVESARP